MATDAAGELSDELDDFGFNQQLDCSIGKLAGFAAGDTGVLAAHAATTPAASQASTP